MTTANTIETIDRASRRIVELVNRVNVLSARRDKLLAACKGLAALDRTPDRFASPELLAARAAIKEAEGQS